MSESRAKITKPVDAEIPGQLSFEDLDEYKTDKFDKNGIIKHDNIHSS